MKFDWTINIGTVLTVLVALAIGYMNLVRRIDRIEANLDLVFTWFEKNIIGGGGEDWQQRQRRKRRQEESEVQGEG